MRNTFTRKQAFLALACALALGAFSATAIAQSDINDHAFVTSPGGAPVLSGFGLCVRNAFGPAPQWTAGCDAPLATPAAIAAPRPKAAPLVVAAAAPEAPTEKVVFDANVLFDSNKSALTQGGRDTLDQFIGKIRGLESQSITAIGYADRMGGEGANQILSEERVSAVKSYLVSQGVASERVKTSAWGESRPSTGAAECKDANNPKNVACMQADRHVFIEISGTRLAK
jgi:OOP family OmpA-OmpF porin